MTPEPPKPPSAKPYRLPAASIVRVPLGNSPTLPPLRLKKVDSFPVRSILKTAPGRVVVPKRLPLRSRTTDPSGNGLPFDVELMKHPESLSVGQWQNCRQ